MSGFPGSPELSAVGDRVRAAIGNRVQLIADPFFTSPLPFPDMPPALREQFAECAIVISKGDGALLPQPRSAKHFGAFNAISKTDDVVILQPTIAGSCLTCTGRMARSQMLPSGKCPFAQPLHRNASFVHLLWLISTHAGISRARCWRCERARAASWWVPVMTS